LGVDDCWQNGVVFFKRHDRRKDGKEHVYYSPCESIRMSRGRTMQRRVLDLGELKTAQLERSQRSIEVIEQEGQSRHCRLFTDWVLINAGTGRRRWTLCWR
jgi:hypothetical protein